MSRGDAYDADDADFVVDIFTTNQHGTLPARAELMRSSSVVAAAGALLAILIGFAAAAGDAGAPPAKAPTPPPAAKPSQREKAREDCLARCRKRNQHTDCADKDGHMMPCPCHCP